jgi:antitoxin PrlF
MPPTATLTSKGQITIPLQLRTVLGLHAGSKLDFIQEDGGFKVIPVANGASTRLKGRFAGRVSKPVSIAEMNEAVASEAAARHRLVGKHKS